MKGIIWYYSSKEAGIEKLNFLIKRYKAIKINIVNQKNSVNETDVIFDNGDIWKVIKATEQSRGQRCNIGLIERNIPENIIYEVLMPCIRAYPYCAYNYWGDVGV